jgi:hypothetical protein
MSGHIFEARKRPMYLSGGLEMVRTVPDKNAPSGYYGYVRTTIGEAKVSSSSKILHDVLLASNEITKGEYDKGWKGVLYE